MPSVSLLRARRSHFAGDIPCPPRRTQHCEVSCAEGNVSHVELPAADVLSQLGALLLFGGFCYAGIFKYICI